MQQLLARIRIRRKKPTIFPAAEDNQHLCLSLSFFNNYGISPSLSLTLPPLDAGLWRITQQVNLPWLFSERDRGIMYSKTFGTLKQSGPPKKVAVILSMYENHDFSCRISLPWYKATIKFFFPFLLIYVCISACNTKQCIFFHDLGPLSLYALKLAVAANIGLVKLSTN